MYRHTIDRDKDGSRGHIRPMVNRREEMSWPERGWSCGTRYQHFGFMERSVPFSY